MPLHAVFYTSLALAPLGAATAPGCRCEVSQCCEAFNNSVTLADGSLRNRFENMFYSHLPYQDDPSSHIVVARNHGGYSAACSFLNLVPGVFDQEGVCSELASSMENTTVCDAIAASAQAVDRLQEGLPLLSVFHEPGTCAELQGGACWVSREGEAIYSWQIGRNVEWCASQPWTATSLQRQWSVSCPREGELSIQAHWVDDNRTTCSGDYSGGLQATVTGDNWAGGSDGSPRWRCFDVPRGDIGPRDYRLLAYSIGDLPCVEPGSSTTSPISGSSSTSLAALTGVVAAAVARGAMM